jgi:signal transduction histidine kinase/ActR/RegA family two-component response regulator
MSDSAELPMFPTKIADGDEDTLRPCTMRLPFVPKGDLAREQQEFLEHMVCERTAELSNVNDKLQREVRERVAAEVALQHSLEYQYTINTLLNLALQQAPMEVLLQRALDMVLSLPVFEGISAGAIFVIDPPGMLSLKVHRGMPEGVREGCAEVEIGQCLCGQAAESRVLMQVTQMGPEAAGKCRTLEHRGNCCLPISAKGETLGVLTVLLPKDWVLDPMEIQVLGGVADVLASIISRERGEAKHAELEAQLRHSQKLEAVGRLAGGVAHDFNNLLTVIQGNVFLNLSEPGLPDQLREDLEGIENASRRAATLTRQLLAFGRKEVLRPQEIEVNTIVRELEKMLRRVIGEDIDLRTDLAEDLWTTEVDPGQLEQVILNLSVNARDAMPRGGQLLLETANVDLSGPDSAMPLGLLPGQYVWLAVRDTGIGMNSEVLEHLFDPFFTTKDVGEGSSGLGLSTAYGVVRQSGGHIGVESEPGGGTAFFIYLPRLVVDEEGDRGTPRRLASTTAESIQENTILLVEDQTEVRTLVGRMLTRAGHRVLEASDGARALEIVNDYDGIIHVVLTDVVMPGMSGNELVDKLHIQRPELDVLYMSGYSDDALRSREVEVCHLLQKPFTPDQLYEALAAVIESQAER